MQMQQNPFMVKEEDLQNSSNVVFGLNTECNVSKFIFNDNINFNNNPQTYVGIEIEVIIEESKFFNTLFLDFTKVYLKDEGWIEEGHESFDRLLFNKIFKLNLIITDYLTALGQRKVNIDKLNNKFNYNDMSNDSLILHFKKLSELVPVNYTEKKVDIFLEYQNQIKPGQDRTYLQIPQYRDSGKFVCESCLGADWTEVRTKTELKYVDDSRGVTHPFVRGEWFLNSKYSIKQVDNSNLNNNSTEVKEIKDEKDEEIAF